MDTCRATTIKTKKNNQNMKSICNPKNCSNNQQKTTRLKEAREKQKMIK